MGAKEAISGVEGGIRSECVVDRNREGIGEAYMLDRVGEDRVGGEVRRKAPPLVWIEWGLGVFWSWVAAEEGCKIGEECAEGVVDENAGVYARSGFIDVLEPEEAGDRETANQCSVRAVEEGVGAMPSKVVRVSDRCAMREGRGVRGGVSGVGEADL